MDAEETLRSGLEAATTIVKFDIDLKEASRIVESLQQAIVELQKNVTVAQDLYNTTIYAIPPINATEWNDLKVLFKHAQMLIILSSISLPDIRMLEF